MNDPESACRNPVTSSLYYVHFFTRHRDDSDEPDPSARWWPQWHSYSLDPDGAINYGQQVLFCPTRTPNHRKYIAWADVIPLLDPTIYLLGPFDFDDPHLNPPDRTPSFRQYIPAPIWQQLYALCLERSILPPLLTMPPPAST